MKPGYKQTEMGVIPEDWDVVQLGDLKPFVTSGSRGWASYYSERGSLFVRITNLSRESIYLDLSDVRFVKLPPEASEGVRTQLKEHDVLISITADIGIVGYVEASVPSPAYINQHIALVRFAPSQASGKFVSYFLASEKPQRLFRASTDVGAKAGMSLITIKRIQTALPPLAEQRAIAEGLSDVDGLLGGLDRLTAKKRDLKQAAMQQLLTGQTRLPGFHGEWPIATVGDEFEVKLGKMLDAEKNSGTLKPFIGNRAVQWGRIDTSDLPTVPMTRSDLERFRLRKGDLLVCEGGEVGRAAIWSEPLAECYYQKALHRLRPIRGYNPEFMLALLHLWSERGVFANYVTQTSIAHLPRDKFITMPLPVPSTAEQTAIAEVLTEMDAELAALEQRRKKTRALKQAMMQELLTGRTRLV